MSYQSKVDHMRCILGLDIGGTKCEAVLARDDGEILGWGRNDPVDPAILKQSTYGGSGRSDASLLSAARKALAGTKCSELIAVSFPQKLNESLTKEFGITKISNYPLSESDAALYLAGEDFGIVALAGTGAFVSAKTKDGRYLLFDALGPMLGDFGGGFHIGWSAIRAVSRSDWNPRHQTSLSKRIQKMKKDGPGDPYNPLRYMTNEYDRSEIASYAKIVNEEAEAGDRIAREILHNSASDLASTAKDIADRLNIAEEDYLLVGNGSILAHSSIYWEHFCLQVKGFAPAWRPFKSDMRPVFGYVIAGFKQIQNADQQALRNRLLKTAHEKKAFRKETA